MKKLILFTISVVMCFPVLAQNKNVLEHSFIVSDNNGKIIANKDIGLRISILQGSLDGQVVYRELMNTKTNTNGVVMLSVGSGMPDLGRIESIEWSKGNYYIRVEMDLNGGIKYSHQITSLLTDLPTNANEPAELQEWEAEKHNLYTNYTRVGIGTDSPSAKLHIADGDVFIENAQYGIIMKSLNGKCWRITINDKGEFVKKKINCPNKR